jgi:hypothetical protein
MPITYEVRNDGNFVYAKASGEVTEDDLLKYQATLLSDPCVKPGCYQLFDGRTAQCIGLTEAVIEKLAEINKAHPGKLRGSKSAIVVRSEYELADQFAQAHDGPYDIMVFFNLHVAQVWLGEEAGNV